MVELLFIVARPEPSHVVVGEHHTLRVPRSTTCVDDIAAHAWALPGDAPINDTVLHLVSQLHNLAPVVNFDSFGASVDQV